MFRKLYEDSSAVTYASRPGMLLMFIDPIDMAEIEIEGNVFKTSQKNIKDSLAICSQLGLRRMLQRFE